MAEENKTFCVLYIHSNKGQSNFTRGYAEGMRRLIKTDFILSTMCHTINGDNPRIAQWLQHNYSGVKAISPGFIIKYPSCLVNELSSCQRNAVLGMGFANKVIKIAYMMYEYLEKLDYVPKVQNKARPKLKLDLPDSLEGYEDICTIAAILNSAGVIISRE